MDRNRNTAGRIRVAVGFTRLLVIAAFAAQLGVIQVYADEPAPPTQSVVLPYANANGYTTTLVIINPTGEAMSRVVWDKTNPHIFEVYEPFSVTRTRAWPDSGVNVETINLDTRLVAYVEIETPRGTRARYGALSPITAADFYDFPEQDDEHPELGTFFSQLFIAAPERSPGYVMIIRNGARSVLWVRDDIATVTPIGGARVELSLGYTVNNPHLPGPSYVYAFALVEHHETGAITTYEPAAVTPWLPNATAAPAENPSSVTFRAFGFGK
jgi:hypothetical protein